MLAGRPSQLENTIDQQLAAERGEPGSTMSHEEPPFPIGTLSAPHREGRLLCVNNLCWNYT